MKKDTSSLTANLFSWTRIAELSALFFNKCATIVLPSLKHQKIALTPHISKEETKTNHYRSKRLIHMSKNLFQHKKHTGLVSSFPSIVARKYLCNYWLDQYFEKPYSLKIGGHWNKQKENTYIWLHVDISVNWCHRYNCKTLSLKSRNNTYMCTFSKASIHM